MVVVASLIGAKGLGEDVLEALQYANVGQGILAVMVNYGQLWELHHLIPAYSLIVSDHHNLVPGGIALGLDWQTGLATTV